MHGQTANNHAMRKYNYLCRHKTLVQKMLKFISWNVNGLRACATKGFAEFFKQADADFFCLQETKMQAGQLDLQFDGYKSYWNYAEKKGYSGTAIYTKHEPVDVSYGIGIAGHDNEGRVVTLEMPDFFIVTVYVPNSQDGLRRLDYRMQWEDAFRQYLCGLDKRKPVIVCGDMNVAHKEIDLKNPATNHDNAGSSRIHRHIQALLSRNRRSLLMVVLPHESTRKECRVAYRLFLNFREAAAEIGFRFDPERHPRFRPLPGGACHRMKQPRLPHRREKKRTIP